MLENKVSGFHVNRRISFRRTLAVSRKTRIKAGRQKFLIKIANHVAFVRASSKKFNHVGLPEA